MDDLRPSLLRFLGFTAVAGAVLWSLAGHQIETLLARDAAGCPHSGDVPQPGATDQTRAAVLCLLNRERAERALPPLHSEARLQSAAERHAEDMGRRHFYAHRNPDGAQPNDRIRAAGHSLEGTTGENIHWGVGPSATPVRIVRDWMHSPGHRANILRAAFTEIGIGVEYRAPRIGIFDAVGTYVTDFAGPSDTGARSSRSTGARSSDSVPPGKPKPSGASSTSG